MPTSVLATRFLSLFSEKVICVTAQFRSSQSILYSFICYSWEKWKGSFFGKTLGMVQPLYVSLFPSCILCPL